jgi:hypothetical protein
MLSIGTLLDAAGDTDTSEPGSCEHVIRERVCTSCRQALGSGDYCAEFLARTCPLSRNAERLLTALEKLIAARATVKA